MCLSSVNARKSSFHLTQLVCFPQLFFHFYQHLHSFSNLPPFPYPCIVLLYSLPLIDYFIAKVHTTGGCYYTIVHGYSHYEYLANLTPSSLRYYWIAPSVNHSLYRMTIHWAYSQLSTVIKVILNGQSEYPSTDLPDKLCQIEISMVKSADTCWTLTWYPSADPLALYTLYSLLDVHWDILNNTMSLYYPHIQHISGLNGVFASAELVVKHLTYSMCAHWMWRGSEGGQGDGDSDSNGEWIYFSIHEHTDPGKDKILDLLICLRDHAEREADIDKDHSQLLASTIPQPLPPTCMHSHQTCWRCVIWFHCRINQGLSSWPIHVDIWWRDHCSGN